MKVTRFCSDRRAVIHSKANPERENVLKVKSVPEILRKFNLRTADCTFHASCNMGHFQHQRSN